MRDAKLKVSALLLLALAGASAACDEMNRPAYVPKATPRHECFSDVECPGGKCFKGPNDVQGVCGQPQGKPDAGGPGAPGSDGGAPAPLSEPPPDSVSPGLADAGPPPPPPPPSPGDTQI